MGSLARIRSGAWLPGTWSAEKVVVMSMIEVPRRPDAAASPKLLDLRGVGRQFRSGLFVRRRVQAVDRVSLDMPGDTPSILAIIGESGSGKTTLARMLLGLQTPSAGTILLDNMSPDDLKRLAAAQVPDSDLRRGHHHTYLLPERLRPTPG